MRLKGTITRIGVYTGTLAQFWPRFVQFVLNIGFGPMTLSAVLIRGRVLFLSIVGSETMVPTMVRVRQLAAVVVSAGASVDVALDRIRDLAVSIAGGGIILITMLRLRIMAALSITGGATVTPQLIRTRTMQVPITESETVVVSIRTNANILDSAGAAITDSAGTAITGVY